MNERTDERDFSDGKDRDALNQIIEMIQDLKFGSVEIVVHENRIVQIEKREKIRIALKKQG